MIEQPSKSDELDSAWNDFLGFVREQLVARSRDWGSPGRSSKPEILEGRDLPYSAIASWIYAMCESSDPRTPDIDSIRRSLSDMFKRRGRPSEALCSRIAIACDLGDEQQGQLWTLRITLVDAIEASMRPDKTRTTPPTAEQAAMFHDLVMRFYSDPLLTQARVEIENFYPELLEPIVQQYLRDDGNGHSIVLLDQTLADADGRLTNFLNVLEYVLHCVKQGTLLSIQVDDLFDYWINRLLQHPRYASLLTYLPLWNYELLADRYGVTVDGAGLSQRCIAVYGTLMQGQRAADRMRTASGQSSLIGTGTVAGRIYEVSPDVADPEFDSSYPCLVHDLSGPPVQVEIYEIRNESLWIELDEFECFDPTSDSNEYVRLMTHVQTDHPIQAAWVYHYVGSVPDAERRIESGDWRAFNTTLD